MATKTLFANKTLLIMDKIKLRSVIFWVLALTAIAYFIIVISDMTTLYSLLTDEGEHDEWWSYSLSNRLQGVCHCCVYFIVSARTVYCLKTGNLFDKVNVYIFFCLTVMSTIISIVIANVRPYYADGWEQILYVISCLVSPLFLLSMSLLYLGAYRAEESNRLTI